MKIIFLFGENVQQFKKYELLQVGSSIKFCLVAEGSADIYPRLAPTSEWDTAAAQAVVEGAGGSVKDLNNKRMIYQKKTILNPFFVVRGKDNPTYQDFFHDTFFYM